MQVIIRPSYQQYLTHETAVAKPVVFYSRVAFELVRKVGSYQKLLAPGSFAEAQAGIGRFFTSFQTGAWKKVTLLEAGYLAGQIGTIGGFFFLGEMIGRRNPSGYAIAG